MLKKYFLFWGSIFLFLTLAHAQPVTKIEIYYENVTDSAGTVKNPQKKSKLSKQSQTIKFPQEIYYVLESETTVKHGPYQKFSRFDGNVIESGNYKYGKRDSIYTEYFEGGAVKSQIRYKNGVIVGEATFYTIDGKLEYKEIYKYDNPDK